MAIPASLFHRPVGPGLGSATKTSQLLTEDELPEELRRPPRRKVEGMSAAFMVEGTTSILQEARRTVEREVPRQSGPVNLPESGSRSNWLGPQAANQEQPQKPSTSQSQPQKSSNSRSQPQNISTEKFSGLRIRNAVLPPSVVEKSFADVRFIRLGNIQSGSSLSGKWATVGVIAYKGKTAVSKNGSTYSTWILSSLDSDHNMTVALFGNAFATHWREPEGSVVGVLNARPRDENHTGCPWVAASQSNNIITLGISPDFGICRGLRKDGGQCNKVINRSRGDFCALHAQAEYNKLRTDRMELTGGNLGTGFLFQEPKKRAQSVVGASAFTKEDRSLQKKPVKYMTATELQELASDGPNKIATAGKAGLRYLHIAAGIRNPSDPFSISQDAYENSVKKRMANRNEDDRNADDPDNPSFSKRQKGGQAQSSQPHRGQSGSVPCNANSNLQSKAAVVVDLGEDLDGSEDDSNPVKPAVEDDIAKVLGIVETCGGILKSAVKSENREKAANCPPIRVSSPKAASGLGTVEHSKKGVCEPASSPAGGDCTQNISRDYAKVLLKEKGPPSADESGAVDHSKKEVCQPASSTAGRDRSQIIRREYAKVLKEKPTPSARESGLGCALGPGQRYTAVKNVAGVGTGSARPVNQFHGAQTTYPSTRTGTEGTRTGTGRAGNAQAGGAQQSSLKRFGGNGGQRLPRDSLTTAANRAKESPAGAGHFVNELPNR